MIQHALYLLCSPMYWIPSTTSTVLTLISAGCNEYQSFTHNPSPHKIYQWRQKVCRWQHHLDTHWHGCQQSSNKKYNISPDISLLVPIFENEWGTYVFGSNGIGIYQQNITTLRIKIEWPKLKFSFYFPTSDKMLAFWYPAWMNSWKTYKTRDNPQRKQFF